MYVSHNKKESLNNCGFGLIEVVISMGIAGILLIAFSTLVAETAKISRENARELRGALYVRELVEVAKDLEQSDWGEITDPTCASPSVCHPEISGSSWTLVAGQESFDDGLYTRSLTIENVRRDQLAFPNTIVPSGGVMDPDTKKIVATLTRTMPSGTKTTTLETYVYNYQ